MATLRLNREALQTALSEANAPELRHSGYDASQHRSGIVHLGLGAFARAHLCAYTQSVLAQEGGDWRIVGVSLRHAEVAEQLVPQDGLYTVVEQSGTDAAITERLSLISALETVLVAPDNPQAVLEAMQDSAVRIVSLTITEKGYCHDPASGELQLNHPDIVWDLANLAAPRTAIGFIVAGLARRFANDEPGFTVLSLDNLPNNGGLLKKLVVTFAQQFDTALAVRIEQLEFPATMVDRIVPATTAVDRAQLARRLGCIDNAMVKTEPFTQWVIEDRFPLGRPNWDLAGALFVKDVTPFETLKLRLLNGSHSAIAYLGSLAGYEFVHEVMADAQLAGFVSELMAEELAPTLSAPAGMSLDDYQAQLLERFGNSALAHQTRQIALDGSQKLPPRILAALRDRLAQNKSFERLARVIAAWFLFIERTVTRGGVAALSDPLAQELNAALEDYPDNTVARVEAYLALEAVFGTDLLANRSVVERVAYSLSELETSYPSI